MATFVIKFIIILGFVLSSNAYADDCEVGERKFGVIRSVYGCFDCDFDHMYDTASVKYDTNKAGMVRTRKKIEVSSRKYEYITTIHNKKGKLMFSRHNKYEGELIMQTIVNGITRKVISGDTRCDFKVIEPSGDTVFFRLESRKKTEWTPQDEDTAFFKHLKIPEDKYAEIIYNRWKQSCQE